MEVVFNHVFINFRNLANFFLKGPGHIFHQSGCNLELRHTVEIQNRRKGQWLSLGHHSASPALEKSSGISGWHQQHRYLVQVMDFVVCLLRQKGHRKENKSLGSNFPID